MKSVVQKDVETSKRSIMANDDSCIMEKNEQIVFGLSSTLDGRHFIEQIDNHCINRNIIIHCCWFIINPSIEQSVHRTIRPSNNQKQAFEAFELSKEMEMQRIMEWNENFLMRVRGQQYNYLKNADVSDIKSSIIVDAGLCDSAEETLAAVQHGLIAHSFEPIPRYVQDVTNNFIKAMSGDFFLQKHKINVSYQNVTDLSQLLTIIDCKKEWKKCTGEILIEPERKHPVYGHCYLFVAITSDQVSFTGMNISISGGISTLTPYALYNSFWNGSGVNNVPADRLITVPTVRVDDIVHNNILWFKVDTQGYDLRTLRGGQKVFENYEVAMIKTEFSPQLFMSIGDKTSDYVHFFGRDAGQKMCGHYDVTTEEGMEKMINETEKQMKAVPTWYCDFYCNK